MTRSQKTHLKVLAVCFSVLILFFGGFTGGWFAHKNSKTEQQADTSAADAGGLVIQEEGESHGIALTVLQEPDADVAAPTAFDPTVENSLFDRAESYMNKKYTLTATATYSDTSGIGATEGLIWTCAFLNPDSDWARGKDPADYISLTGDTSTSRTAYRKNDFAEPIVIKVAAESHPERYATCQADCMQKITKLEYKLTQTNYDIPTLDLTCVWNDVTPIMLFPDYPKFGMGGILTSTPPTILEKSSTYTIPLDESEITWNVLQHNLPTGQDRPMVYAPIYNSRYPEIMIGSFYASTLGRVTNTNPNSNYLQESILGNETIFSIEALISYGYNGTISTGSSYNPRGKLGSADFADAIAQAFDPQRPNKEEVITNPFVEFAVQARYQNVYVGFFATQFEIAGIATL